MIRTEEKGVTLVALVTTIILLLILASIGVTLGISSIDYARFSQFKEELKVLQTKVNELNQDNKLDIGQELSENQKKIFGIKEISNIIFKDKSNEEKQEIEDGFRYCSSDYINTEFNFENIERDYIINVQYRYVIFYEGFEYKETIYYMTDQLPDGLYNVRYIEKSE